MTDLEKAIDRFETAVYNHAVLEANSIKGRLHLDATREKTAAYQKLLRVATR